MMRKIREVLDFLLGRVPEEEWRKWPLPKQRAYLGLGEGQNPPAPRDFIPPRGVVVPEVRR